MHNDPQRKWLLALPAAAAALALGSLVGVGDARPPAAPSLAPAAQVRPLPPATAPMPPAWRTDLSAAPQAGPPAAPLVETAAPARHLHVCLDQDAAEYFDQGFERAFEAAVEGVDLRLEPLPGRDALDRLLAGRCDAALMLGEPGPRELQAGLWKTLLGCEVPALAVPAGAAVRGLSSWQLRALLGGELRSWRALGGDDATVTLVLPTGRVADRAAACMLAGTALAGDAVRVAGDRGVYDQLLRTAGSIGLVRAASVAMAPEARLLPIDGVVPTRENVLYGFYPFGAQVNLITAGAPTGLAAQLWQFAAGQRGRALLERQLSLPL